jgi:hypothetical protein
LNKSSTLPGVPSTPLPPYISISAPQNPLTYPLPPQTEKNSAMTRRDYQELQRQRAQDDEESSSRKISANQRRNRMSLDNKAYRPSKSDVEESDDQMHDDGKKRRRRVKKRTSVPPP